MNGDIMIDPDLLIFLNDMKKELKASFKESEQHIKETLQLSIDPIKETLERHTKDIDDLYTKDRENRDRFGKIEADVKTLKDDKDDNKHDKEIRVGIWAIVSAIAIAAGGWVISLFVK